MYHAQFGLGERPVRRRHRGRCGRFPQPQARPNQRPLQARARLAELLPSAARPGRRREDDSDVSRAAREQHAARTGLARTPQPTNAAELLELVLVELGVGTARTTRIERLQLWRQFQGEMRATESRLFVVVERTEDIACEVLHALDSADGGRRRRAIPAPTSCCSGTRQSTSTSPRRCSSRCGNEFVCAPSSRRSRKPSCRTICGTKSLAPAGTTIRSSRRARWPLCIATPAASRDSRTRSARRALELAASQQQKLLTAELVTKTAVSMLGLAEAAPAARSAAPAVSVATVTPSIVVQAAPAVEPPKAVAPVAPAAPTPAVARTPAAVPTAAAAATPATVPSPATAPTAAAVPRPAAVPNIVAAAPTPVATPVPTAARAAPAPVTAPPPSPPVATASIPAPATAPVPAPIPTLRTILPSMGAPGAHRRVRVRRRRDRHHRRRHGGFPRPDGRGRCRRRRRASAPQHPRRRPQARRLPSLRPRLRKLLQQSRA